MVISWETERGVERKRLRMTEMLYEKRHFRHSELEGKVCAK